MSSSILEKLNTSWALPNPRNLIFKTNNDFPKYQLKSSLQISCLHHQLQGELSLSTKLLYKPYSFYIIYFLDYNLNAQVYLKP